MSIINDALKKAQANLSKRAGQDITKSYKKIDTLSEKPKKKSVTPSTQAPKTSTTARGQTSTLNHPKNITTWVGTAVILTCMLLTAGYYTFRPVPTQTAVQAPAPAVRRTPAAVTPAPAAAVNTPSEPAAAEDPNALKLSGISVIEGKKVAIINGEIYELGETVKGMKIVDIRGKGVDLMDGGKIMTLDVRGN